MQTKDQKMAQKAYECVTKHPEPEEKDVFKRDDYTNFALSFPSLIHSCGLVQAVAFAKSKKKREYDAYDVYIKDLEAVLNMVDHTEDLAQQSRDADLAEYTRISRHALSAASWLKRYCQETNQGEEGKDLEKLPESSGAID